MGKLYQARDVERGVQKTYEWLMEEVKELGEALQTRNPKAMEEEFADVIAWLSSLANVVGIDLERAALAKYSDVCPRCGQSPCGCPLDFKSSGR